MLTFQKKVSSFWNIPHIPPKLIYLHLAEYDILIIGRETDISCFSQTQQNKIHLGALIDGAIGHKEGLAGKGRWSFAV